MKDLYPHARDLSAVVLCLSLCVPSPAKAADEDTTAMKRAIEDLQAQNRALANRLATLEAERNAQRPVVRTARPVPTAQRPGGQQPGAQQPGAGPSNTAQLRTPPSPAATGGPVEGASATPTATPRGRRNLEQRVAELEVAKTAQEDAVRGILRGALAGVGSRINEFVTLGGAIEVGAGWSRDFSGQSRDQISLNTAELDFEVRANDWTFGNLVLTYSNGTDVLFPTTTGFRAGIDRLLVDKATVTIGDTQRFPFFLKGGLDVVPFGSSTGVARLDSLAINTPLTTEAFETRRTIAGFGFEFPTPAPAPPTPSQTVPTVRPRVINPLFGSFARGLGYAPLQGRPKSPSLYAFPAKPPPFYGSVYFYDSNNIEGVNRRVTDNINARLGYRTSSNCGRPYSELQGSFVCPWSFDVSVDYNSSIFDSRFLESGYRPFLRQIGYIPGLAATVKMGVGPFSVVGEVVGAIKQARFTDDANKRQNLLPCRCGPLV